MKKKNLLVFGSAVMSLMMAACGQSPSNSVSSKTSLPKMDEETANAIIEKLEIVDKDAIYGNIYLPEEVDGANITWTSSDTDIISDKTIGQAKPGVVTRYGEDYTVTMTALIEKDGLYAEYSQEVTVMKLENELEEDDYEGYLFGHFISEDGKEVDGQKVAVGEQMYFALADVGEGLHFKDLSTKNNPLLSSVVSERGVRDPFMMRSPEGDRFFIVATDLSVYTRGGWGNNQNDKFSRTGSYDLTFWESKDLVNWEESRSIRVAPTSAGMAWAPEMIYHQESGQYVIFFASCLVNEDRSSKTEQDAIYYVTTRDFVHFSDAKLLIDNQKPSECSKCQSENLEKDPSNYKSMVCKDCQNKMDIRISLDASITYVDGTYYYAIKDGDNNVNGGGILIAKTNNLFDPDSWEKLGELAETGMKMPDGSTEPSNKNLEGPEWFKYNVADRKDPEVEEWGLMGDQYMNSGAGYLPFGTTDIEDIHNENNSWRVLKSGASNDYSWDSLTKRHGTIMRITAEECQRIKENGIHQIEK